MVMFTRIFSQIVIRDDTGSTRNKMMVEKVMPKWSTCPSEACCFFLAAAFSLTVFLFSCPSPFMSIPLKLAVSNAHSVLPGISLLIQTDSEKIN